MKCAVVFTCATTPGFKFTHTLDTKNPVGLTARAYAQRAVRAALTFFAEESPALLSALDISMVEPDAAG